MISNPSRPSSHLEATLLYIAPDIINTTPLNPCLFPLHHFPASSSSFLSLPAASLPTESITSAPISSSTPSASGNAVPSPVTLFPLPSPCMYAVVYFTAFQLFTATLNITLFNCKLKYRKNLRSNATLFLRVKKELFTAN